MNLSKKDVFWGYFSQFFILSSGIITLPYILKTLTANEIGMNYLMLTIGSLVSLFDFGFSPQFGRNITYIFSGAQSLKREGVEVIEPGCDINYHLLATMIHTAKFVYRILASLVFILMISLGSMYIYKVTKGFSNIDNSFLIWVIYCISTFFNIYYSYYTSLLMGKGLIMESRKATVYSKFTYIFSTFLFLYLGLGLLGVALANLISPFINRFFSYAYFFTTELKEKIESYEISRKEISHLFNIIWFNAKKLGLVFVGGFAINKLSMFLAGLYLPLADIASYGLMIQLIGIVTSLSGTLFGIYQPKFSALRISGQKDLLYRDLAFSMNVYYILYIIGALSVVILVPWILSLIGSNAVLPALNILLIYAVISFLEGNHSNFATFITTNNDIPFVESSLIIGALIGFFSFIFLRYTNFGILGLILIQGIIQLMYSNWKWPYVVCVEFSVNFTQFVTDGVIESRKRFMLYSYHYYSKFISYISRIL